MKNSKAFFKVVFIVAIAMCSVVATIHFTGNLIDKRSKTQREVEFLGGLPYELNLIAEFDKYVEEQKQVQIVEELETIREQEKLRLAKVEQEESVRVAKREREQLIAKATRGSSISKGVFSVTNYNLSVESCGKSREHPQYGLTASGYSLKGMSRTDAMTIAVDRRVIPLESKVLVEFVDEKYSKYTGIYVARDTGGAIKGNIIDIFMGENATREEVMAFGRTKAKVTIIND